MKPGDETPGGRTESVTAQRQLDVQTGTREQRAGHRVPVRVAVGSTGGELLGETRDLSLDGAYVSSLHDRTPGDRLPVTLQLGGGRADLVFEAEVVRADDAGLGLRFDEADSRTRRELRRFIADLTSVEGRRDTARRLLAVDDRSVEPLRDRDVIREALATAKRSGATFAVMPAGRQIREEFQLSEITATSLVFTSDAPTRLRPEEEVFILYVWDFTSWTFGGRVVSTDGNTLRLPLPALLAYSERRGADRAQQHDIALALPVPWSEQESEDWPVLETSQGGLSLRVPRERCSFRPGLDLPRATLRIGADTVALEHARVRHVTEEEDDRGPYLRVGISHGDKRRTTTTTTELVRPETTSNPFKKLGRTVRRWTDAASYLWTRRRTTGRQVAARGSDLELVRIPWGERTVTGLLTRAFPDEDAVSEAPLVIVVPGFAGRKEQTSFLANVIAQSFRRQHEDIAVLRIDGTNNLGESWKSPEARGPGRATYHFRVADVIEDLRACMAWARNNRFVQPSRIVLVSVSFGSVPVRHFLASGEAPEVSLWVSWFGAADARNSIQHVSGHLDLFDNHARGLPQGVNTLGGCVVDVDHFFQDLLARNIGQLADARREIAQVSADVAWICGRYDAYMDPRRVRDVMSVDAPGARDLFEVDSGHVPTSGEEALAQSQLATRVIWQHCHGSPLRPANLSIGRLQALASREWERVRREGIDRQAYWREYLLADDHPGFDVLTYSDAYNGFVRKQLEELDPRGQRVLDLGAGTGNLAAAIARQGPRELICADLVPEALAVVEAKLAPIAVRAKIARVDADGSPRSALARWLAGDLGIRTLARRLPGIRPEVADELADRWGPDLHAVALGRPLDHRSTAGRHGLTHAAEVVLGDLAVLARFARGELTEAQAGGRLVTVPAAALRGKPGLPWPDGRFDRIVMSLLLSYLDHPDDALAEARRLLVPGGRLVVSSMRRDADSSRLFHGLLDHLAHAPDHELEGRWTRAQLQEGATRFLDRAADLFRLQEEGLFRFYDEAELEHLLRRAGFRDVVAHTSLGNPGQAVIVSGTLR